VAGTRTSDFQTRYKKKYRRRDTADVQEGVASTIGEIATQTEY